MYSIICFQKMTIVNWHCKVPYKTNTLLTTTFKQHLSELPLLQSNRFTHACITRTHVISKNTE